MNTRVNLAGVLLKNPIMTASGTFGSGQEYSEFVDLNKLGAVVTKGVANVPWPGNPTPRVAEVYGGMLNAIGLQNPGIDVFVQRDIPFLTHYDTRIIVNVCGKTASDYIEVVDAGTQYFLPKCQRRRYCLWTECCFCRRNYKRSEKICKTAGYYEIEPECNGYYRDGKSGRSRRSRCNFPD